MAMARKRVESRRRWAEPPKQWRGDRRLYKTMFRMGAGALRKQVGHAEVRLVGAKGRERESLQEEIATAKRVLKDKTLTTQAAAKRVCKVIEERSHRTDVRIMHVRRALGLSEGTAREFLDRKLRRLMQLRDRERALERVKTL